MKGKKLYFRKIAAVCLVSIILSSILGCTAAPVTTTTTVTSTAISPITTTITNPVTVTTTFTSVSPTTVTTSTTATATTTITTTGESSSTLLDFVTGMSRVLPSLVVITDVMSSSQAAGTGWILNDSGVIVTNAHVVNNASNIQVTLSDGSVYSAESVKTDINSDLAVIKISASGLTPASIGDSSNLKAGQRVAAVGNSLDMGIRITSGLVSRLDVTITYSIDSQTSITLNGLIETDATINPGNSGGALIDISGNLVGITNAGLSGTNISDVGFGYAIPITGAMSKINSLVSQLP